MERFIKYKRFEVTNTENIQQFFDELIKEGWEIIYYNEVEINGGSGYDKFIKIIVVAGKKQKVL